MPTDLEPHPEAKQIHLNSGYYLILFTDDFVIKMQNT